MTDRQKLLSSLARGGGGRQAGGGLLIFALLLTGCHVPDPGPTTELAPATFQAVLVERGEVGSEREEHLSSPFSAKIDTLVPEGTLVKPGDQVIKLGDEEAVDQWERARLKDRQNALQLPLTTERGRLDVWRLGLERDNAALDLKMAKLRYRLLDTGRDGTAIVDAAQTLGTLKAERETIVATLPEATTLHQKGYISDADLAQMKKRLAEIDAETAATRVKLGTLEAGPRREELSLERLKVEEAAGALAGAEKRLRAGKVAAKLDLEGAHRALALSTEAEKYRRGMRDAARMVAKSSGVVIYDEIWTGSSLAKLKAGDTVEEGQSMVTIADPGRQVVRAHVLDAAAARLRVGQLVQCRFDAFPGLVADGRVRTLAPVAAARLDGDLNKLQAIEVMVALDHPDAHLRPGMSANLAFVLASEPNQLAVPTQAIVPGSGVDAVYVLPRVTGWRGLVARLTGERPERRPVTLGGSNERETVVKTGLAAGERVLLRPPAEGAR